MGVVLPSHVLSLVYSMLLRSILVLGLGILLGHVSFPLP